MTHVTIPLFALLVDIVVGDPSWILHPVVILGRWISTLEKTWNRPPYSHQQQRRIWAGTAMAFLTVGLAWGIPFCLLEGLHFFQPFIAILVNVWLTSTTIAWKGLVKAGKDVHIALTTQSLEMAREKVGCIVGRDTLHLSSSEVVRAAVETLAENIVDAIVSPVFFAVIGGAPLAMAYRAVNTLDSMVGYKNERYLWFGRVSAKMDDVANWVPARLTMILLFLAIAWSHLSLKGAWIAVRRDAKRHPSPNAGLPEAMVAGALSVQLGGTNVYHGVVSHRATMGDPRRPLHSDDIRITVRLVNQVSRSIILILCTIGGLLLWTTGFKW